MYICIFACILTDNGQTCCPNLQIFKFDKIQMCRLSCKLHDNLHLVEHTNSFNLELLEELHRQRRILSWVLVGETFTNITFANLRECSDTLFTSNLQMCFLQTEHWLVHANMQICIYIFDLLGQSNTRREVGGGWNIELRENLSVKNGNAARHLRATERNTV